MLTATLRLGLCAILAAVLALSGVASVSAKADAVKLTATVDKSELTLEDTLQLSLTVEGVQNAPPPKLPDLPNFRIRSRGTASSTRIINGETRVSFTYNFLLAPAKAGAFEIGPSSVEVEGKTYRSEPIRVIVSKTPRNPSAASTLAYVETSVSNKNPYVNEQIEYTFRLFRKVDAKNLDLKLTYDDSQFRKEDMGDARIYMRVLNGVRHHVHELSVALFPIHPGKMTIPGAEIELDLVNRSGRASRQDPFSLFFDDPFNRSRGQAIHKILRSDPIQLNVKPLPKKGRPADFTGLVGQFEIDASLSATELEVGDSTTWTVTVKGPASVKNFSLPAPDLGDAFKVYPDQPKTKTGMLGEKLAGEKIFKFALVPLKEGPVSLPPAALSWFDPKKKRYRTARTMPVSFTVSPSSGDDTLKVTQPELPQSGNEKKEVAILGEDLFPIHTRDGDFADQRFTRPQQALYAAGFVFPVLAFFVLSGFISRSQRLKHDVAYSRRQNAFKTAASHLKQLSTRSPRPEPKEFARELSQIVRDYLGDRLNLHGQAITSREVDVKLAGMGFNETQTEATKRLLERLESLQYAPAVSGGYQDLLRQSWELIQQLEKPE